MPPAWEALPLAFFFFCCLGLPFSAAASCTPELCSGQQGSPTQGIRCWSGGLSPAAGSTLHCVAEWCLCRHLASGAGPCASQQPPPVQGLCSSFLARASPDAMREGPEVTALSAVSLHLHGVWFEGPGFESNPKGQPASRACRMQWCLRRGRRMLTLLQLAQPLWCCASCRARQAAGPSLTMLPGMAGASTGPDGHAAASRQLLLQPGQALSSVLMSYPRSSNPIIWGTRA